jgi:hypothetical protein
VCLVQYDPTGARDSSVATAAAIPFVVNVDGTGMTQVTPDGADVGCCRFDWSPDGSGS